MKRIHALAAVGAVALSLSAFADAPAVVPAPREMKVGVGSFARAGRNLVGYSPDAPGAGAAAAEFANAFGGRVAPRVGGCSVTFSAAAEKLPAEGYLLSVTPREVAVRASDGAGFFYAVQTLRQLSAGTDALEGRLPTAFPCVEIKDYPRYPWRGVHIDDCRHFFGVGAVKHVIDQMAFHKLNTLHWHLTDDQGWRLAIDKYPELVKYGATRPESPDYHDRDKGDGRPYGPFFYTRSEVRQIVTYAKLRHVEIVPEIELPGHARAALAAYPALSCVGESLSPRTPWTRWGISADIFCGGNPDVYRFLEDVLDEVCEMFPSKVVHIGGDEAKKDRWKQCPKCQARIKELGLKNEAELQTWLTKHFVDYLAGKGRRAIGWDEILEGGMPSGAMVMSWRGTKGGEAAAAAGHDVVMTPTSHCYFDFPQGLADDPHVYANWTKAAPTLESVYRFDPCQGIAAADRPHVLGAQCNNWAETTLDEKELMWKLWPRASALAEALWTAAPERDFADFLRRMTVHRERLVRSGVNCAPLK